MQTWTIQIDGRDTDRALESLEQIREQIRSRSRSLVQRGLPTWDGNPLRVIIDHWPQLAALPEAVRQLEAIVRTARCCGVSVLLRGAEDPESGLRFFGTYMLEAWAQIENPVLRAEQVVYS